MDLKDLTPKSDTYVVELKHPTTGQILNNPDDTPMTITLYAPHTKEYKAVVHAQANERLAKMSDISNIQLLSEDIEAAAINTMVKTTKEWNITFDGKKPDCTEENRLNIYTEVFWIKDQIDDAASKSLDFMKA